MVYIWELTKVAERVRQEPFIPDDLTRNIFLLINPDILRPKAPTTQPTIDQFARKGTELAKAEEAAIPPEATFRAVPILAALTTPLYRALGKIDRVDRYWVTNRSESLFGEGETHFPVFHAELHEVYPKERAEMESDFLKTGQFYLFSGLEDGWTEKNRKRRKNNSHHTTIS